MALPSNFSHAENFQDVVMKLTNKRVRKHFADVGPDDWEPDLSTDRGRLRIACTHQEKDTLLETIGRLLLFNIEIGSSLDDLVHAYAMPVPDYHESVEFKPQVSLEFYESYAEAKAANRNYRARAVVSFRLTDKESHTITQADISRLQTEIRTTFPKSYVFKKGRHKISYRDKKLGYELILSAYTEAEAKELITKVLSLRNHTPNWEYFNNSTSGKNFNEKKSVTILGKRVTLPKRRPIANVRLKKAELKIHGRLKDIVLYDSRHD